ncbi:MAG: CBS domain-containing protein [Candidatus Thorarchaeota archaeon]
MSVKTHFNNTEESDSIGPFMIRKVIKVKSDVYLTKAAKLMIENNIGSVLVEISGDKFSILTKTDIIRVLANGDDPRNKKIADIIGDKDLITCFASDSLEDAMLSMAKNKIERLVVIDTNEKIVGIISSSDILKIAPGLMEIKREQQFITDAASNLDESFEGYCDSCKNFDEQLQEVGGFALCKECIAERSGPPEEEPSDDDETM